MLTRRHFSLYDITLQIHWRTDCQHEVERFIALFPFSSTNQAYPETDLNLSIQLCDSPAKLPDTLHESNGVYGLKIHNTETERIVCQGKSLFRAQPCTGSAQVLLHRSFLSQTAQEKANFFLVGMFQLLLARGLFDLHAAGLIRADGIGYLLLGESGSGKSTTALSLVCNGWHYLSDDALMIRAIPGGVEALGFRKNFFINPSTARHWREVEAQMDGPGCATDDKYFVDLEQVFPHRRQVANVPQVLIFCSITPTTKTVLKPLDRTQALTRLLAQSASLSFNREFAQQHLELLKKLVTQTQSYQLLAGRDVYNEPDRLTTILGEIEVTQNRVTDVSPPPALESAL